MSSMTCENLTADADALRQKLGFERWAVLGHSFGGQVALEYALRYPGSLSHLVLLDTGGDSRWPQQNAADLLAQRGYSPKKVELVRRWFNGQIAPARCSRSSCGSAARTPTTPACGLTVRDLVRGQWHSKMRPEALIFAGRHLLKGWTVMDRLGEITVPTLVMAGRDDFVFPPEHQLELADAHSPRAPADHRARWAQPALRADRRGHGGRQGLHLRGRAADLTRIPRRGSPRQRAGEGGANHWAAQDAAPASEAHLRCARKKATMRRRASWADGSW